MQDTQGPNVTASHGWTRRRALGAGAMVAGTAALAACGVGDGGAATTPAKVQGKVTALFFTSTEPAIDRMKKQEASFREKYPEVQLTTEAQPTAFTQALTTRLAAGTPPDVHWIGADFWRFVGQGTYVDLGPIIAKDKRFNLKEYYPAALQAYTWQDKMRALAYGVNTHTMSYNKRLLQQEGLPAPTASWTVQQFTDQARRLTKDTDGNGAIDQAGFGNWPSLVTTPFLFGGSVWDKGFTKAVVDSPEAIAGWEWLHDVWQSSRKVYPTTDMLQGTNINNLMGQGKIGFFSTGRFSVPVLKNFTDLDWDMVVYPTGPSGKKATFLSVEGYAMTAATKDQEAAFKLMEHLCGRQAQEDFYLKEGNVIPAIKAVAESPGFSSPVPGKNHKAHLDSLEFGVQPNNHPIDPDATATVITPLWNEMVTGAMQPREMARVMAQRLTDALNTWKAQNKS
jgi:multiple sugar transport system substrate-binding protein